MLLSFIFLFSLLIAGLGAGLYALYKKKTGASIVIPTAVLIIGILFIIMFGLILTPLFTFQFEDARDIAAWPSVEGHILSSDVVGDRAYRPDITYDYFVAGDSLQGSSNLNIPGFGGRMNRLDAAEKLVHLYPPGKTISVFYNPDNPVESTLNPNPSYSLYLKLGTSILLSIIGFIIIFINGFRSKKKH